MRPTYITIDLNNLKHNARLIKKRVSPAKVFGVVKANAYGHGIDKVSQTIAPYTDAFAVANLTEALSLRKLGLNESVLLLEGVFEKDELSICSQQNFEIVVHSTYQVAFLKKVKLPNPVKVWVKLNTGMNRLGFNEKEFAEAYTTLMAIENVRKPVNLMSHFATSDEPNCTLLKAQYELFLKISQKLKGEHSIANSAGIFASNDFHLDWVRPGLALYGVSPLANVDEQTLNLKPVMSVASAIIAIHQCQAGQNIGYGAEYTVREPMRIGVVAIGYGDGYPLHVKRGHVLINGQKASILGRVSMDMLSVNLSNIENATIGTPVTLWGEGLGVREVANFANTISYDLLTRTSLRANRITK